MANSKEGLGINKHKGKKSYSYDIIAIKLIAKPHPHVLCIRENIPSAEFL